MDLDLIRRLDGPGPRYTSYPTADRFVEAFDNRSYEDMVAACDGKRLERPVSLYFHLPFCASLCYFCACNKIVTRKTDMAVKYLDYLVHEMRLQSELFGGRPAVSQLHWGGGTPTFLPVDLRQRLMAATREHFALRDDAEISIEIDPRKVGADDMQQLGELGFNRISVGVQDFDPRVQKAVNRIQTVEETRTAIEAGRASGVTSVNLDLIYGLPHQTPASFSQTLDQVIALSPDRLSVYNYAHLPGRFAPQRRIRAEDLPGPDTKLALLKLAITRLTRHGYVYIGMDHFAKADDELTHALEQGRLQRNFQGYSTHADCDLVALGITGIGKVGPSYSQNVRTLEDYYDRLDQGELPIMRGVHLSRDDLLRRTLIQSLMCHFALSIDHLETTSLIDFRRYFATEIQELEVYRREGLVELDDHWLRVTPRGRLLIRNIGMIFDRYLRESRSARNYSRVI